MTYRNVTKQTRQVILYGVPDHKNVISTLSLAECYHIISETTVESVAYRGCFNTRIQDFCGLLKYISDKTMQNQWTTP